MIYLSPKGVLFAYEKGTGETINKKKFRVTDEQLKESKHISYLPKQYLFLFKDIDIDSFISIKESGEADLYIIDRLLKNGLDSFMERLSICMVDGNMSYDDALTQAKEEL